MTVEENFLNSDEINDDIVEYVISAYPSKYVGYQNKRGKNGVVKAFVTTIWNAVDSMNFDKFVDYLDYIITLERMCLERGFQRVRMKDRCKPFEKNGTEYSCKMDYIVSKMSEID